MTSVGNAVVCFAFRRIAFSKRRRTQGQEYQYSFIVFPLVPTSIRIFLLLWQVVEPARRQHFSGYSDGLPFRRLYSFLCLLIGDHIVECVQNFRFGFFETSHWLCSRRT